MRRKSVLGLIAGLLFLIIGFAIYRQEGASPRSPAGNETVTLPPPPGNIHSGRSGTHASAAHRASIELKPLPPVAGMIPPSSPPPPPRLLPKPPPGWYLQVAAYYGVASAKPLAQKLRQAGFGMWFSPTVYHGRRYVRIWIGPYRTRRSAYPHMARITALAGASPFWVRVGSPHVH